MNYNDFLIGGLSGVISRTVTAPLELAKIQQQNKFMPNTTLREVIQKEGFRGLWKGNYSNCIRIFPQMAINYAFYQYSNNLLKKYINNKETVNFISGGLSGMIAMSVVYPLETARSRLSLQTNRDHYKGMVDVFKKTPIKQLYNGLKMSLIGFTPYNALNFMFYNYFKEMLNKKNNNILIQKLQCGGLSGMVSITITYPSDLIRRRLQLQGFDKKVPIYNGITDCILKIYKLEGIRGFYRGLIQCYIKIIPASAIQFWVMEIIKLL
jgi:solute carrier family 25 (mitochondrial phosphate transporter), member 23/24/25/41